MRITLVLHAVAIIGFLFAYVVALGTDADLRPHHHPHRHRRTTR